IWPSFLAAARVCSQSFCQLDCAALCPVSVRESRKMALAVPNRLITLRLNAIFISAEDESKSRSLLRPRPNTPPPENQCQLCEIRHSSNGALLKNRISMAFQLLA